MSQLPTLRTMLLTVSHLVLFLPWLQTEVRDRALRFAVLFTLGCLLLVQPVRFQEVNHVH